MKEQVKIPKVKVKLKNKQNSGSIGEETGQAVFKVVLVIIGVGLVLFILLGGINQRKFLESIFRIGSNIGEKTENITSPDIIDITDDGIYLNPDKVGQAIEEIEK